LARTGFVLRDSSALIYPSSTKKEALPVKRALRFIVRWYVTELVAMFVLLLFGIDPMHSISVADAELHPRTVAQVGAPGWGCSPMFTAVYLDPDPREHCWQVGQEELEAGRDAMMSVRAAAGMRD
jgi:hypothetical protein